MSHSVQLKPCPLRKPGLFFKIEAEGEKDRQDEEWRACPQPQVPAQSASGSIGGGGGLGFWQASSVSNRARRSSNFMYRVAHIMDTVLSQRASCFPQAKGDYICTDFHLCDPRFRRGEQLSRTWPMTPTLGCFTLTWLQSRARRRL